MVWRRQLGGTIAVLASALALAGADELRVGSLKYSDITVLDFTGGQIVFRFSGHVLRKDLRDVSDIYLGDYPDMITAETFYKSAQAKDAVRIYEGLLRTVRQDFLKNLIRQRIADATNPPPKPAAKPRPSAEPAEDEEELAAIPPELKTPEAFLKFIQGYPQDRAQSGWSARLSAWRTKMTDIRGKLVRWEVQDAALGETPTGAAVKIKLGGRVVLAGLITRKEATALEDAGSGAMVRVRGTVGDYYAKNAGLWRNVSSNPVMYDQTPLGVEMLDVTVRVLSRGTAIAKADPPADPKPPVEPVRPIPRIDQGTKRDPKVAPPKADPVKIEPRPEPKPEIIKPRPPRKAEPPEEEPPPPSEPVVLPPIKKPGKIEFPKDHGRPTIFD